MRAMVAKRLDDGDEDLLADYRNVPDADLMARRGLFVAEGRLVVTRLLAARSLVVRSVLVTEAACLAIRDAIVSRPDVPVHVVTQRTMNGIIGFNIHRGCLALGERPPARDWRALVEGTRRLVVLERVGNADNVGSIFRNSAAFGMQGVLLGPSCADPLYRKAIRTSMAASLTVPFAHADAWPGALRDLRGRGWHVIGLTPDSSATTIGEAAVAVRGRPFAVVLGHEGEGLTGDARAACDTSARIPMSAGTDSLNVAAAAAVALYELTCR
jgi:tRNA G18 (ribose-2'-O)-methylase SpoU